MEADKECSTGILIDLDTQEGKEMGQLSVQSLHAHKNAEMEGDKTPHVQETNMEGKSMDHSSLRMLNKFDDLCIETVLRTENKKMPISKSGWETPSPQSMKRINKEACRIIDQLATPIESTETLLDDEEFPLPCSSDEGGFDECLHDFEKLGTDEDSSPEKISFLATSPVTLKATTKTVLLGSEFIATNFEKVTEPMQSSEKQCSNSSKSIRISNSKQIKDMATKADAKTKNIRKSSDLKTAVKSKEMINKENGCSKSKAIQTGMRYSKNIKNVSNEKILSEANDCKMTKSKYNAEKSLNANKVVASISQKVNIKPEKVILQDTSTKKSNRSSNVLPRLTGAKQNQPVSRQRSDLNKSTSMIMTPTVSKSVHRTNSLRTEKVQHSSTIKKEPCFEQKSFLSSGNSTKKNTEPTTASSIKPAKSRLINSHIPSPGVSCTTPLKRSNSLSKVAAHHSSQILQRSASLLTTTKVSRISRPYVSSTTYNSATNDVFKKPAASTSSSVRFKSKLDKESLICKMNDSVSRELFPAASKYVKKK